MKYYFPPAVVGGLACLAALYRPAERGPASGPPDEDILKGRVIHRVVINDDDDPDTEVPARQTVLPTVDKDPPLLRPPDATVTVTTSPCLQKALPSTTGRVAIGVKTTNHYHKTRAAASFGAWGRQSELLMFVTDKFEQPDSTATDDLPWHGHAETVLVETQADSQRQIPYLPPWRQGGQKASDIDPMSLPRLVRRVAELLKKMLECWGDQADWFFIVDDDTFVRVDRMQETIRSLGLDASVPHLLGAPVFSEQFTRKRHWREHGASSHCGGGAGVLLSRGLLRDLVPKIELCLEGEPRTTLFWYWDEVELLGRCVYEFFRINCTDMESAVRETSSRTPDSEGPPLLWGIREGDWDLVPHLVESKATAAWKSMSTLTMHPVTADRQRWLAEVFA
eukprot:TRINITY_DN31989_c0_g1_i2.p1 TRINITY_DN31989_c0_g1~~TRINITY_DN31989_c0_g1_i2.p1  ORF type:complete len:394 (+),score=68.48 TRINITY_DN31989_c0_g1_i2:140-1321(+)